MISSTQRANSFSRGFVCSGFFDSGYLPKVITFNRSTSIVINAPQLQAVFLIVQPVNNDNCTDPQLPNWDSNLITEFNLTCERQKYISTPDLYYNTGAALSCVFSFLLDAYEVRFSFILHLIKQNNLISENGPGSLCN